MQFHFDFDQMYAVALVMLQEDELLSQMRFALVPKLVKEEVFWRNYFYCVSLIKQSAPLMVLASQEQATRKEGKSHHWEDALPLTKAVQPQAPTGIIESQIKTQEDEEEISTSPAVSQFVSIDFGACNFDQEDMRKELSNSCFTRRRKLY